MQVESTYDPHLINISGNTAIDIANEMINSASHRNITRISGSLNIVSEQFQIRNTNGMYCSDDSKNILQWSSLPTITPTVKVGSVKATPI
jgi:PmbA protein